MNDNERKQKELSQRIGDFVLDQANELGLNVEQGMDAFVIALVTMATTLAHPGKQAHALVGMQAAVGKHAHQMLMMLASMPDLQARMDGMNTLSRTRVS